MGLCKVKGFSVNAKGWTCKNFKKKKESILADILSKIIDYLLK